MARKTFVLWADLICGQGSQGEHKGDAKPLSIRFTDRHQLLRNGPLADGNWYIVQQILSVNRPTRNRRFRYRWQILRWYESSWRCRRLKG